MGGNKNTMDEHEFWIFANQFAHHYHMCPNDGGHGGDSGSGGEGGDSGSGGEGHQCVSMDKSMEIFNHIDTNHDGELEEGELRTALTKHAEEQGEHFSKEDVEWITQEAHHWASRDGNDNHMNPGEFNGFANAFAGHFGMCGGDDGGDSGPDDDGMCVSRGEAHQFFSMIDTSNDGQIDEGELTVALGHVAEAHNHTITAADKAWVGEHAEREAGMQGNKSTMNEDEFWHFANQFAQHYDLCPGSHGGDGGNSSSGGEGHQCVSMDASMEIFNKIDTNHDGELVEKEIRDALTKYAEEQGKKFSKDDVAWITAEAHHWAARDGNNNHMNPGEFNGFANAFAAHFGMCH